VQVPAQAARYISRLTTRSTHKQELLLQEQTSAKQEREERLKRDLERSKEEAMRRIPTIDAFGRAYATGRRKTAIARVWLSKGTGNVTVNRMMMVDYFKRITLRDEIYRPMQVVGGALKFDVWATVSGGGLSAQAGAIRLGVARALQAFDSGHRVVLKEHRLLTQDDRKVGKTEPDPECMWPCTCACSR
jgi:small subunit ribosomal protein S9